MAALPDEPTEYAPGVYIGSQETTAEMLPSRVRWKTANVWGWGECQTCGATAATRRGMHRHEAFFHGGDEGLRETLTELGYRVEDAHGMLDRLPGRAGLALFPWRRRRYR